MHDLPLLTFQQLNAYGIMHEHMNAWSWHWNKANTKQTLIQHEIANQANKTCKIGLWKQKNMEKKLNKTNMWKQKKNKLKKKLGFLGKDLRTQEQVYVRIIKPARAGKIMRTQVLAQKP